MSVNKTYAVFGLGKYGKAVATELVKNGAEVLGCTVVASRLFVLPNSKNSLGCLLKPLSERNDYEQKN